MRRPRRSVFVNGTRYAVQESAMCLKADLNGVYGWTSVWADTYTSLVRRIKQALDGRQ